MKKRTLGIVLVGTIALAGGIALAQQSEFQAKMAEDMKTHQPRIVKNCGTTDKLALHFEGKLAGNPRETLSGEFSGVSALCVHGGLGAIEDTCLNNKVVASALSKLTDITCVRGTGTLSYKLDGSHMAIVFDPVHKNAVASQRDLLIKALKQNLDK